MSAPPAEAIAEVLHRRAADDGVALCFEGQEWTWRELVAAASARAAVLEDLRRPGPFHIGVLLENTVEHVFLLAAAALGGAVIVSANPTRRGDELARDLRHTDCQLVVTDATQAHLVEGLDLGIGADRVLRVDGAGYQDAVAARAGAGPPLAPTPDALFLLIFTSGSTAAPKAVRMTQGRAAVGAGRMPFASDDVLYSAMPLSHGNALNATIFPSWATGARVVLRRRFSASHFFPDIAATGATFTSTVGRAIAHVLATPPGEHDRGHALKFVLGPETSDQDARAFRQRFGVPVFQGYGSSENAITMQGARVRGAMGVANEGDDLAAVDPETGIECPRARFGDDGRLLNAGEAIGELVGRNLGHRFEGYYDNAEADADRVRDGWYWSGDLVYRDADGVFFFAGRAGDWLRVDSENFAAAPVERILQRYEPVRGVAVYPVPDARTGDQVMAALEVPEGTFDPIAFGEFLAAQPDLGTKWAPRYLRVVRALPVTGTDKLDKKPLRAERWTTTDPIWHRPPRSEAYVPFTDDDREVLHQELRDNGRETLLEG